MKMPLFDYHDVGIKICFSTLTIVIATIIMRAKNLGHLINLEKFFQWCFTKLPFHKTTMMMLLLSFCSLRKFTGFSRGDVAQQKFMIFKN